MKYWGKDIRDALHGDGPLAFPVLRRRAGHVLAQVGGTLLGVLLTVWAGVVALTWGARMVWITLAGIAAICGYIFFMMACLFDRADPHTTLGWGMAIVAAFVVLYAIGKAFRK